MLGSCHEVDDGEILEKTLTDKHFAERYDAQAKWTSAVAMAYCPTCACAFKAEIQKRVIGRAYRWTDFARDIRVIAPEDIYPQILTCSSPPNLTEKAVWLKRPNLFSWSPEGRGIRSDSTIASTFKVEIEAYEFLWSHGFNGIAQYYGTKTERGRAVAIALKRYPFDLSRWPLPASLNERQQMYDAIEHIVAGLNHLGFAHNDLKPHNIVVAEDGQPLLIDLEDCRRIGEPLRKAGTPQWNDGYVKVSDTGNDRLGLTRLRAYLQVGG